MPKPGSVLNMQRSYTRPTTLSPPPSLVYIISFEESFRLEVQDLCVAPNIKDHISKKMSLRNLATNLCRQVNIRELLTNAPIYNGLSDVEGGLSLMIRRWATKKTAGSTKNGGDSKPKFLGVKKFGGEKVIPGNIIVRQRGTRFHPGNYVGMGKDHTLHALKEGRVKFERHKLSGRKWVHVEPTDGHVLHPIYTTNVAAPKIKTTV